MAFDAFLKIQGVDSESTRKGHEKEIELIHFNLGAMNPSTVGHGGGGGSGKVELTPFHVTKYSDSGSVALFQSCCMGKHFPKATITLYKSGGNEAVDYLKYDFEEVFVDSINWSGSTGGDDRPTEEVTFTYAKMVMTYTEQKPDGTKGSPKVAGWDQKKVQAA